MSPRKRKSRHHSTIQGCLNAIGVDAAALAAEPLSLDEQFRIVKQAYRAKALETHPDKGGNPEEFREIQTSFEVLRELYSTHKITSFVVSGDSKSGAAEAAAASAAAADYSDAYDATWQNFSDMPTPSWDFFYEAAQEDVPLYRVELAKSDRSKCKQHGNKNLGRCNEQDDGGKIGKGDIRVGSLEDKTGTYTRWMHLKCWRVPNRVWKGLPNYKKSNSDDDDDNDQEQCQQHDASKFEIALLAMNDVLFCGLQELSMQDRARVVEHVMNKDNYARDTKPRTKKVAAAAAAETTTTTTTTMTYGAALKPSLAAAAKKSSHQIVKAKQVFVIPRPGQDGVLANLLVNLRVVLTGVFPEVGGGVGLTLGKDKVKRMVESFGGRVTGSVSGKTDLLITGKEPGASKVYAAQGKGLPILSLLDLKNGLEGNCIHAIMQEKMERPLAITNFSSGYNNNSVVGRIKNQAASAAAPPMKKTAAAAAKKQAPKPQLNASAPAFVPSAEAAAPPRALLLDAAAKDFAPSHPSSKPAPVKKEDAEEPALEKKNIAVAHKPDPVKSESGPAPKIKSGALKSVKEEPLTMERQQATKKKSAAVAPTKRKPKSTESNNDKKSSPTESYSDQEPHEAPPLKKPRQQSKTKQEPKTTSTAENEKPTTTTTTSKGNTNTNQRKKNAANKQSPKPSVVGTRSSKRLKALTNE